MTTNTTCETCAHLVWNGGRRPSHKEKFYNIARSRKVIKCGKIIIRK